MKTLKDIKKEIKEIEDLTYDQIKDMKRGIFSKLQKKLEVLRIMEMYLETNPNETFVQSELNRCERIVSAKMLEFQNEYNERNYEKLAKKEVTKLKKKHEDKYDLPKIRTQVRALRFLAQ